MAGEHEPGLAAERTRLLTTTTFGIWIAARIDPAATGLMPHVSSPGCGVLAALMWMGTA